MIDLNSSELGKLKKCIMSNLNKISIMGPPFFSTEYSLPNVGSLKVSILTILKSQLK
jgi:hypothetical protein